MEELSLIIVLAVCVLQIILFFKVWGACNSAKMIRVIREAEFHALITLKTKKLIEKFGERTEQQKMIDFILARKIYGIFRDEYIKYPTVYGLSFASSCQSIVDDLEKKNEGYKAPEVITEILLDKENRDFKIRYFLEL